MKKSWLFISVIMVGTVFIVSQIVGCLRQGNTDHVVLEYGDSLKFSKAEIQAAADCVLEEFKSFKDCDLQKLWYDEEVANREYGVNDVKGIVLLSNFHVGASGGDGGFESNAEMNEWQWLIERDSRTAEWRLVSWGYA